MASALTTAGGDGTVKIVADPAILGVCTQRFYAVTPYPADEVGILKLVPERRPRGGWLQQLVDP
jgi:hypothetical protein